MISSSIHTPLHLYQPVKYCAKDGTWHSTFEEAIHHSGKSLTFDPAAILSILSFGYICGDRTIVNEVKRKPWLSEINEHGETALLPIPGHSRYYLSTRNIAKQLIELLCDEIYNVCKDKKEIYILLSGGYDSRITAGIVHKLIREGKLDGDPIGITWGMTNSRDVVYAKQIAENLEFKWIHVDLDSNDFEENIKISGEDLGATISPIHLHRMSWFKRVSPDSIVLASTYGDIIGRAEVSKRHLLEKSLLKPSNAFELLKPEIFNTALEDLSSDLENLRARSPLQPKYVICEHEMTAHYLRGLLAQAMNLINRYCSVYQVFTAPKVYSFMWSIHPTFRTDKIYKIILESLHPSFSSIPWARTNRTLKGKKAANPIRLQSSFHQYNFWLSKELFDKLSKKVNGDWIKEIGLFRSEQFAKLIELVKTEEEGVRSNRAKELFAWLLGLRSFIDWCSQQGISVLLVKDEQVADATAKVEYPIVKGQGIFKNKIPPTLIRFILRIRRTFLLFLALIKYPLQKKN